MNAALKIGALGFALIAVCYGFARFAFGLFLPQIGGDIELSSTVAGTISGGAFAMYCIAILVSARLSELFGPRPVAVVAAVVAAVGMLGVAVSTTSIWLAVSVILAGVSTGLASPPLADAVGLSVQARHRDLTNTVINAGTSAGVVVSGVVALSMGRDWRWVFMIFAVAALVMAVLVFVALSSVSKDTSERCRANAEKAPSGFPAFHSNLKRLVMAAFLMGAASTALWSFGGAIAQQRLGWMTEQVGLLWTVIGAAGVFGAGAGWLTSRFGINWVHWLSLSALAASVVVVGLPFTTTTLTLAGGVLFGAAYVMLTGVYLVWGTEALPERPGTGLTIGFLAISIGQTLGSPLFGLLMDYVSLEVAILSYAILGLGAGFLGFSYQATSQRCPKMSLNRC